MWFTGKSNSSIKRIEVKPKVNSIDIRPKLTAKIDMPSEDEADRLQLEQESRVLDEMRILRRPQERNFSKHQKIQINKRSHANNYVTAVRPKGTQPMQLATVDSAIKKAGYDGLKKSQSYCKAKRMQPMMNRVDRHCECPKERSPMREQNIPNIFKLPLNVDSSLETFDELQRKAQLKM